MSDDKRLEGALANLGNEYSPPEGWQDRVFAQIADEECAALIARAKAGNPSDDDILEYKLCSDHAADWSICDRAFGLECGGIVDLMPQSMARGLVALAIEQEREKGESK